MSEGLHPHVVQIGRWTLGVFWRGSRRKRSFAFTVFGYHEASPIEGTGATTWH